MSSPVPGPVLDCGAEEPVWHLVCVRPHRHEGTTHIGATADGMFEGYWGSGVVHVSRVVIKEGALVL